MTVTSNIHTGLTAWASGQTVTVGARCSSNSKAYQATTAGTTSGTAPAHTSGAVSDGGVTWLWLSAIDYTSVSAWAAAIPATLTQPVVGQLWNDGEILMSGNPWLSLSGHTTSTTNTITLCAAPGESFIDNASALQNAMAYNPANGVAIRRASGTYVNTFGGNDQNVVLRGLQVKGDVQPGNQEGGFGTGMLVDRCLFDIRGNYGGLQINAGQTTNSAYVSRHTTNTLGSLIFCASGTTKVYNCTFVAMNSQTGAPLTISYGNLAVINCLAFGFGNLAGGRNGSVSWDHGVSDVATTGTGPGFSGATITASLTGKTAANQFVSPTTDFRPKPGADTIDNGTTVSGMTAIDMLGVSRPQGTAWDVGPLEYKTVAQVTAMRPFVFAVW